jgi:hypothetical protein
MTTNEMVLDRLLNGNCAALAESTALGILLNPADALDAFSDDLTPDAEA